MAISGVDQTAVGQIESTLYFRTGLCYLLYHHERGKKEKCKTYHCRSSVRSWIDVVLTTVQVSRSGTCSVQSRTFEKVVNLLLLFIVCCSSDSAALSFQTNQVLFLVDTSDE